jgi:hypothetical protein
MAQRFVRGRHRVASPPQRCDAALGERSDDQAQGDHLRVVGEAQVGAGEDRQTSTAARRR